MKQKLLLILFLSTSYFSYGQIYESEMRPDGILFPRMNTAERKAISNPIQGQTVFDTEEQKLFWFEQNFDWVTPAIFRQFGNGIITLDQRLNNYGNLVFTHYGAHNIDTTNSAGWGNTI